MSPRCPIIPTVVVLCLAWSAIGCPVSPEAEHPSSDSATLNVREWRLILLMFDRNHEKELLAADIQEFAEADLPEDSVHRIVVRDSQVADGTFAFVDRDTVRTITDAELLGCDLTTTEGLRTVLGRMSHHFPAPREALLLTGHGRDWTGFGLRSDAPEQTLTSTATAAALSTREKPPQAHVLVADGSWTAGCEWIAGFSGLDLHTVFELHTVTVAGEVPPEGLDYRTALTDEALQSAEQFAVHVAESVQSEPPGAGVALTPHELQTLPTLVETIATAGVEQIQSAGTQQELKADLLDQAVSVGAPGSSWISLASGRSALGLESSGMSTPALDQMLVYLTDVDLHGVPTGHRSDYCSNASPTRLSPEFQALGWAPDHEHRRGFLYQLWYHRY